MPKMIKNKFFKYLTYENLEKAYNQAKRNKRMKVEVIQFEMNKEYNLIKMLNELKSGVYKFGEYKKFKVYEPKERDILAAPFRDRIVHTWYVKSFIETIFIPQFISTSYACILNRGTLKCVTDVKKCMHNCSDTTYVLKMDVAKFFLNINKDILYKIICRKISDENILKLTRDILNSSEKVPIGNYSSQMFANIYLNDIDQFAKHTLKCKKYYRYMDDTVIFCDNKEQAKFYLKEIEKFLTEKLKLKLNSKTNIMKISQGINFCGYKINKDYIKVRNRAKYNLYKKVKYICRNNISNYEELIVGHMGHIMHCDCYRLVRKLEEKYNLKLLDNIKIKE